MRSLGYTSSGLFAAYKGAYKTKGIAIVEAPIDALSLAVMGLSAVACFGTNLPDCIYAEILRVKAVKVWLASDADEPGDKAANSWQKLLAEKNIPSLRLRPRGGFKDWNEVLVNGGGFGEWQP
jgi:DNA primase